MVRLVQLAQVLVVGLQRDRFGIARARLRTPAQQHVGRRLQVDDEIGRRDVARQQIVEPLIDEQLVVVEIQIREDLVLVEQVVADRDLAEEIGLPERRLLAVAVEQIEELRLQRGAGPIGVEVGEKRILGFLEHEGRVEARAEPFGQRGFARADRTFDRDVAELQGGPMISSRRRAARCCGRCCARRSRLAFALAAAACASAPRSRRRRRVGPTFEQKMAWILRLEDQRVLRDPAPPVAIAAAVRGAARRRRCRPPPPPPDLVRLLADAEARMRRRAALASAASGLRDGVAPLVGAAARRRSRSPADGGVRARSDRRQQRARSAGHGARRSVAARAGQRRRSARPDRRRRRRRADRPAGVADRRSRARSRKSRQRTTMRGAITPAAAFRLGDLRARPAEGVRPAGRGRARRSGQPSVRWWPVAFALQRLEDPRALPALAGARDGPAALHARVCRQGPRRAEGSPPRVPALLALLVERRTRPSRSRRCARSADRRSVGGARAAEARSGAETPSRMCVSRRSTALGGDARSRRVRPAARLCSPIRNPAIRAAALRPPRSSIRRSSSPSCRASIPIRTGACGRRSRRCSARCRRNRRCRACADARRSATSASIPAVLDVARQAQRAQRWRTSCWSSSRPTIPVRAAAADGLGELKPPSGDAGAGRGVSVRPARSTYVARAAALDALAKYGTAAATPAARKALADKDWAVRVRAAMLLKQLDPASAADVDRADSAGADAAAADGVRGAAADESAGVDAGVYIDTDRGTIQIELAVLDAPLTVETSSTLARKGFFDGLTVHRVVPDFVVQGGDPRGDGEGGPGYTIRDELNERPYLRGTVGMALDWARHRRQPVLHHALAAAAPRREVHGLRPRHRRHGRRRQIQQGDVIGACGCGTESSS